MPAKVNLIGKSFDRLTVLSESPHRTNDGKVKWLCLCVCGIQKVISGAELRRGDTRSCGCLTKSTIVKTVKIKNKSSTHVFSVQKNPGFTHGKHGTSEYNIWRGMKARCYNENEPHYNDYGGRGIIICDRWKDNFQNFFDDMGLKPTPLHSIDRINNDGNYEPGNCKWSTKKEQGKNKRNNRWLEYNGIKMHLQGWADHFDIPVSTLHSSLKVNSFETIYLKYANNR